MDDDLAGFYRDFQNTIRTSSATDGLFTEDAFVSDMSKRLSLAEEVDALIPMHFEAVGAKRRKLAVDGYDFGDEEGHAVFAVADYSSEDDVGVIGALEVKNKFAALESFIEAALDGSLAEQVEESSDAYQVAAELSQKRETLFKIRLYLLTNRRWGGRAKKFESTEIRGITIEYHLWDVGRLYRVETSQLGREEIDIDLTEWAPGGIPVLHAPSKGTETETFLAVLPGSLLAGVYRKYGGRVLEANVRSFLTVRGNVNRGIRGTVQQQPEMFLAYNNGIAATATDVTVASTEGALRMTSIRDLQIVNGGQTTASLFYVEKNDKADLAEVFVQMKLIVVRASEAADLVPKISRYANTQNRVSEADFFSNHPFHVRMEEKSRRLLTPAKGGAYFQTKWYYERTRGQYLNEKAKASIAEGRRFETEYPKTQVMTKTDAAKYIVSWGQRPHTVSSGAQKNFIAFADTISKEWVKGEAQFGEAYFQELVAKGILFNAIRAGVQRSEWYSSGYLANIVTYTLAKLSALLDERRMKMDFIKLWQLQMAPAELLNEIAPISKLVFDVLTREDRPVVNVTEWAKREKCWEEVKSVPFRIGQELDPYLISAADHRDALTGERTAQRIDSGIGDQVRVMELGSRYWVKLRAFGREMKAVTPKELGVLNSATGESGRLPSEAQSKVLVQLSARMEKMGFVGN